MANKDELRTLKGMLESLHTKVDLLSAEVASLRSEDADGVTDPPGPDGQEEAPEPPSAPASRPAPPAPAPEANAARDVVFDFVAAALIVNDEKCWSLLEGLTHSGSLLAPRSLDHLKAFSWKKLRVNARRYFQKKGEITALRIEPEVIQETTDTVKVFVAHGKGASSPVTVARDSEADGDWRVQGCSL
jgi:hypothetical protein